MQSTYFGLKDATLSHEALCAHAREVALERVGKTLKKDFPRLQVDAKRLTNTYTFLSECAEKDEYTVAGGWLLDNFHLLEQTIKAIELDVGEHLPLLTHGAFEGLPRAYRIAVEMVGHTEGSVDAAIIAQYLHCYQSEAPLLMKEIYALKDMLLIALIKLCSIEAGECVSAIRQRQKADEMFDKLTGMHAVQACDTLKKEPLNQAEYIMRLCERLREVDSPLISVLEAMLIKNDTDAARVSQSAHRAQVRNRMIIGNVITSVREISRLDWEKLFCRVSRVEETLLADPIYGQMDALSRNDYREAVARIAKKARISEVSVAVAASELAQVDYENVSDVERQKRAHVGFYLCSDGLSELRRRLGKSPRGARNCGRNFAWCLGLGSFFLLSFLFCLPLGVTWRWKLIALLPSAICAFTLVHIVVTRSFGRISAPLLPRLELDDGVSDMYRTLVVIPALATSPRRAQELAQALEVHHLATRERNVLYMLLGDYKESDQPQNEDDDAILEAARETVSALNAKYGEEIFYCAFRRRVANADGRYGGRERKRGALMDLNALLLHQQADPFEEGVRAPVNIRYVLTLDADTVLPIGAAKKLIGAMAHPLNQPEMGKDNTVVKGHGLIAPRIELTAQSACVTPFARIFAQPNGLDSYDNAVSELFQDLYDEGNFAGKGIYDVRCFAQATQGLPDNAILSHDLLEGSLTRAGLAANVVLYDDYPATYAAYCAREHRWTRGDWQNLFLCGSKRLRPLHRFKLLDNLRRSLVAPSAVLLFLLAPLYSNGWIFAGLGLFALLGNLILDFFASLLRAQDMQLKLTDALDDLRTAVQRGLFSLAVLPYEALRTLDAAFRALYRAGISHKKVLEWTTAAENEKNGDDNVLVMAKRMWPGVLLGVFALLETWSFGTILLGVTGIAWIVSPFIAARLSRMTSKAGLCEDDCAFLQDVARRCWAYFEKNANEEHSFLPPDNVQIEPRRPVAARTSPTNIGLALCGAYAAHLLGFVSQEEMLSRCEAMFDTLEKMEKWHGHLYNWYNTITLAPMRPRFVSSVDNGNYATCLITLREGVLEACKEDREMRKRAEAIAARADAALREMDFSLLFDEQKRLFYVGYDCENGKMNDSHYDLLASESRMLSFCAIAKGDVGSSHWFRLARPLTTVEGRRLLVSWSGTMFEYLMPHLFMYSPPHTLLDASARSCVAAQRKFITDLPWGVSESGFYEFDLSMNYQYRAFGIPGAGVKASRTDKVIAPYASMLALMVDAEAACDNLQRLKELGAWGEFGFFEALDATGERVKPPFALVKSFMAHHQGMSLLAACNVLTQNGIANAFHAAPEVRAVALLLSERAPSKAVVIREYVRALPQVQFQPFREIEVMGKSPRGAAPQAAVLGDAAQVLVYSNGKTRAMWEELCFYRTDLDPVRGEAGCVVYVADKKNGVVWNAADADACFESGKVIWQRSENDLRVKMEICSPIEPSEIRQITLQNAGGEAVEVEVYAYVEVCLSKLEDDRAHMAFQKLFIESDNPEEGMLVFRRRQRRDEPIATLAIAWQGSEVSLGNSRIDALGRHGSVSRPAFLRGDGLKFHHAPIDPCALFVAHIRLEAGETKKVGFAMCMGDGDSAVEAAREYHEAAAFDRAFALAHTSAQVQLRHLGIGTHMKAVRQATAQLYAPGPLRLRAQQDVAYNTFSREELWRLGVSGDVPVVLMELSGTDQLSMAKDAMMLLRYLRLHAHIFDLIIVCTEEVSYSQPLREGVLTAARAAGLPLNATGGVFCLESYDVGETITLLRAMATLIWRDAPLSEQFSYEMARHPKQRCQNGLSALALELPRLDHWNGWGGFDEDDYVIRWNEGMPTPLPWSNIMANDQFGCLINESGGGYTYAQNSRENKLTPWRNDAVSDPPGECLLLRDEQTQRAWSVTPQPLPCGEYVVRHGHGYSRFRSGGESLYQDLTVFVDVQRNVKIFKLWLKNPLQMPRELSLFFCAEWVLDSNGSSPLLWSWREGDALLARNGRFGLAYIAAPGQEFSYTTSREEFFGSQFGALRQEKLLGQAGVGADCCSAMQIPIRLLSGEEREIVLLLGFEEKMEDIQELCAGFLKKGAAAGALERVKQQWNRRLQGLRVTTDDKAFDRMMNGKLLYQVWNSRLLARMGFYQCGGAFGFRDQLQDVLALLISDPERAKTQILLAAAHQFSAGDVQHWWHPPARGVRTRISDDLLFLPYVTERYAAVTGDESIWDEEAPFLEDVPIPEGRSDIYDEMRESGERATLYEHCMRAVKKSLDLGEHGLPKIGGGDWNDGMDEVMGESVWLGWFLYAVISTMLPICSRRGDDESHTLLESHARDLQINLQKNAWDGEWYRRAYFANGQPLGSSECSECMIDSISQSWAVLSGAADEKRSQKAMQALYKHLVDRQNGMIKLLAPPFDKQLPRAGYIQGYTPGMRENGGQYTHAAVWAILATARMGDLTKAFELWSMINPIRHSDNPIVAGIYKGEPYVMAADVYAHPEHMGRAGWTWYTGAASWMYVAGLELLGFEKRGDTLLLNAAAADVIGSYMVEYRYHSALYLIRFEKGGGQKRVELVDDGERHEVTLNPPVV